MNAPVFEFMRSKRNNKKSSIIQPNENAWRTARAEKVAFLIDGADYYACLDEVLRTAKKSIWIVGWDFNPDIYLRPDRPSETLGELLHSLADNNAGLEIRILVWDMGPIYSGKSLSLFREKTWSAHPRISLRFDNRHPLRGSHHQKIVAVDQTIGFLGGIDLTARRWDDSRHLAENPTRVTPDGDPYEPVHDLQAAVSGKAAEAIADLCRRRWERALDEHVPPHSVQSEIWPENLESAFKGCDVAISLTEPGYRGRKSRKQAMQLTVDALKTARKHVYIETQYFAFFGVAACLENLLKQTNGPEVVVVLTRASHGFLEKVIMGGNRDRLIRKLKRADRYGRLRVVYPVVPKLNGEEQDVLIHSKLLIIDDHFLRIGSSNLNNRSEGLDTEADIALEAAKPECCKSVVNLRDKLLAEHLDTAPEQVSELMRETGSLLQTIDQLNVHPRGLRNIAVRIDKGKTEPVWGTDIVDPRKPYWPLQQVRSGVENAATRLLNLFL